MMPPMTMTRLMSHPEFLSCEAINEGAASAVVTMLSGCCKWRTRTLGAKSVAEANAVKEVV